MSERTRTELERGPEVPGESGVGARSPGDHPAPGEERIRELEDRIRRLSDRLAALSDLAERRGGEVEVLRARYRESQAKYANLRARPAVRASRRTSELVRAVRGLGRRGRSAVRQGLARVGILPVGWHRLRVSAGAERRLVEELRAGLPPAPGPSAISVGVLIVSSGAGPTDRLRDSLTRSQVVLAEVRTVPSLDGRLADAVADLRGDAVLIVSDAVEPIEDGWLLRLLAALEEAGAGIIGAGIVHGRRPGPRVGKAGEMADLTVRHLGLAFDSVRGVPLPRLIGHGADPRSVGADQRSDVAAVDTCLLLRRTTLDAVGGLAQTQELDVGDADLCLRIRAAGGRVVVARDVMLLHRGPDGGPRPAPAVVDRLANAWSPYLFREVLLDRLAGRATWSTTPIEATLAGAGSPDDEQVGELVTALGTLGWAIHRSSPAADGSAADATADIVVLLDPSGDPRLVGRHAIRVAIVRSDVETWTAQSWFDDLDVVLVPDEEIARAVGRHSTRVARVAGAKDDFGGVPPTGRPPGPAGSGAGLAQQIAASIADWAAAPHIALVIGAETWERAAVWGDSFFARGLQRELERRGAPTVLAVTDESSAPHVTRADVTIALFGSATHQTRSGQVNVLWIISHPDRVTRSVCDRFDLIFAASDRFAGALGRRLGRTVLPLHQATDPDRFHPAAGGPRHALLFVGNSRGVRRPILDDLADTPHELAVYGRNWSADLLDPRRLHGDWVPNEELGRFYASAEIVLSDHWADMRDEGFIANRVYDAAAAGGFVISDHLPEIDAEFDGGVVTYRDAADLRALVDRFLADPAARAAHARIAREAVLRRHTFASRANTILEAVTPVLRDRRLPVPRPGDSP
ncbi:MAG TPA: glycosyltransferase [Patescibacteria group bacterium]|nr:glycosyltransferase [Patescibacteria group bacterium]